MRAALDDWNNGWFEVEVSLTTEDIDRLIALLRIIKADPSQHFHATSDFAGAKGVGQITFEVQQPDQVSNLSLGGRALSSGEEI